MSEPVLVGVDLANGTDLTAVLYGLRFVRDPFGDGISYAIDERELRRSLFPREVSFEMQFELQPYQWDWLTRYLWPDWARPPEPDGLDRWEDDGGR